MLKSLPHLHLLLRRANQKSLGVDAVLSRVSFEMKTEDVLIRYERGRDLPTINIVESIIRKIKVDQLCMRLRDQFGDGLSSFAGLG
jgi:intein/homing endonuclease